MYMRLPDRIAGGNDQDQRDIAEKAQIPESAFYAAHHVRLKIKSSCLALDVSADLLT